MKNRCGWVGKEKIYKDYHDEEWGIPEPDSRSLWEKLCLDGFQAGLSWIVILKKRDGFREAFDGFDPYIVADYGPSKIETLVKNSEIVRHRGKIEAMIGNARAYQNIEARCGFHHFLWNYMDGRPLQNNIKTMADVPTQTKLSKQISDDLKREGFKFCGPTIVYAFMQAVGMVNDHTMDCHCFEHVKSLGGSDFKVG